MKNLNVTNKTSIQPMVKRHIWVIMWTASTIDSNIQNLLQWKLSDYPEMVHLILAESRTQPRKWNTAGDEW